MSRIGRQEIKIPEGVNVKYEGGLVTVSKGKLTLTQELDPSITMDMKDGVIHINRANDERDTKALHGLYRALVNNMVIGVTQGFEKHLEVNGVGYRAQMQGSNLVLTVGMSHPVTFTPPEGITLEVPENTKIIVKGADKQLVGEVAAKIRSVRPPEPYKGKGIKYDYEVIRLKEGKRSTK